MKKIAVLGAGSWGTALAIVLADNGHEVRLWGKRTEQIDEINNAHTNEKYLPGVDLPDSIKGYIGLKEALADVGYVVIAIPTKAIRDVVREMTEYLPDQVTIVHASKGIEPDTHLRVSEMIVEELGRYKPNAVVALSGPSHAEEVSRRQPTTVTVSSENMAEAEKVQDLFMNKHFRVYTNPDIIGVEIGGALKNIIALGAGISDGLGFGDNSKAALMTRGLAEIARLGVKLGANPLTFSGLSGLGDLIVTCTSSHSRNWRAGNMLGKGYPLEKVLEQMGMVVEGIRTTKAAYQLAKDYNVSMPITESLYQVLFHNRLSKAAVEELMNRLKTDEMEELAVMLEQHK